MADVGRILKRIRANGANIAMDAGRLRVVNGNKLPSGALDFIKLHAKQIAAVLESEADFEERAAIIEFDGGLSRQAAEDLAGILLASPPKDCDPADWNWFVGKAADIIDARRRAA